MATLSRSGATSVQYRKFAPRNPMGMKKLNKKIKSAEIMEAGLFVCGKLVVIAKASIQSDIPDPLTINTTRRPNRSMQ